jgi:hypothetical protein
MFSETLKAVSPWGAQYLIIGFAGGTIPKVAAPNTERVAWL